MGRVNKRIAAAKLAKTQKNSLSTSKVLKSLAKVDEKPKLDFKLLLEKPTKKSIAKGSVTKVTKKDKMKIRKDHLQNKLKILQEVKNQQKEKVKRQKKAIIGDLRPISETLDKILNEETKKESRKKPTKKGLPPKQKRVKEQMNKDLEIFQQVLKHPQYSKDPFNTISTHIENSMLMEAMND